MFTPESIEAWHVLLRLLQFLQTVALIFGSMSGWNPGFKVVINFVFIWVVVDVVVVSVILSGTRGDASLG